MGRSSAVDRRPGRRRRRSDDCICAGAHQGRSQRRGGGARGGRRSPRLHAKHELATERSRSAAAFIRRSNEPHDIPRQRTTRIDHQSKNSTAHHRHTRMDRCYATGWMSIRCACHCRLRGPTRAGTRAKDISFPSASVDVVADASSLTGRHQGNLFIVEPDPDIEEAFPRPTHSHPDARCRNRSSSSGVDVGFSASYRTGISSIGMRARSSRTAVKSIFGPLNCSLP
jgi:hypothetical protein